MAKPQVQVPAKKQSGLTLGATLRSADLQFAVALIGIIFILMIPLPPFILDLLLSVSITSSVLILLISVYVKEPLEFSTFPTLLLVTTLFRLGLNVATTKNILLKGATGQVSHVVDAFGKFVVGGNYFVGFVIFIILVIINFIVITKGAGRVAEVSARFTLDAMPGKQMSIDAELNGGMIDKDEAKKRRLKIENEADFYGAMDGASKFVRGDAIAAIVITGVNIVVGLLIGILQYDLSFADAAKVFTLLTVGEGLVSQIPALIISVASGIIITRTSSDTGLSDQLSEQVLFHPKALFVCSGLLVFLALIPGLPKIPFLILAVAFFFGARYAEATLADQAEKKTQEETQKAVAESSQDSIDQLLHVDTLSLEVGVGLIPLVDRSQDGEVLERIVSSRKQFAQELGIIVPIVMVRDNIQLKPGEYQILLRGNVIGRGNLMVDYFLAMDPGDIVEPILGIKTKEPAYGLDAVWIKPSQKEEASFKGYTVVNGSTVIVTHLTKLIGDHAHELIGRQDVQQIIDKLKREYPKVAEEVVATDRLALGDVLKVLQNLLHEGVSIRDSLTIFETLADYCKTIKHPDPLTRYVRRSLGRGIIKKYLSPDGKLIVINLDRGIEDLLSSAMQQREDGTTSLQVDPEIAQRFLTKLSQQIAAFQTTGTQPILLCGPMIRTELSRLVQRFVPGIVTLSYDEVPQGTATQSLGLVSLG